MDHHQREIRRSAAKAFSQSLDQLATSLEVDRDGLASSVEVQSKTPAASKANPNLKLRVNPSISLKDLEDAAADIESYMQMKH